MKQPRLIELRRLAKRLGETARELDRILAKELEDDAISPDELADKIREATREAVSRPKNH